MKTAVGEGDARSGDEVLDSVGREDFSGAGEGRDARADVHGDSSVVVASYLAFAGVDAGSDADPERARTADDRLRAPDRSAGPSKTAKKLSPAVLTSRPRKRVSWSRTSAS